MIFNKTLVPTVTGKNIILEAAENVVLLMLFIGYSLLVANCNTLGLSLYLNNDFVFKVRYQNKRSVSGLLVTSIPFSANQMILMVARQVAYRISGL